MKNKNKIRRMPIGNLIIAMVVILVLGFLGCRQMERIKNENEYRAFLKTYEEQVVGLEKEATLAYYNAITSGKDEDYKKSTDLNLELNKIYLNGETFQKLKTWKDSGLIRDPLLKRQLEIQYIKFLSSQSDKDKINELTKMQNELEQTFYTFRAFYNGKKITDNDVENILRTSINSTELKNVWTASKKVGDLVSQDIIKMAKMRNEIARDLGFADYQKMALSLSEQDPAEMDKIFDDLDVATRDIYKEAKDKIDQELAKKYKIQVSDLRPWHYQNRYFQEVPDILNVNLDELYKQEDVLKLVQNYYQGLGLPIADLVKNSDLYARPGKYQHAIAFDIDREGDIRVVCNIENNNYWMHTLLHEFGHALYFQQIDRELPWELREPSHIFTTEAVAIFFQDMVYSPEWMSSELEMSSEQVEKIKADAQEYNRLFALIFSRWTQVMYRFEKGLYENPDQDLNKLWWDLVEKYQLVKRPDNRNNPDWATKIHIISTPVYYQNYMLGYLYASQLRHYINNSVIETTDKYPSYSGKQAVGAFLAREVFAPGTSYNWRDLIKKSTGEKLNLTYFAKEVQEK